MPLTTHLTPTRCSILKTGRVSYSWMSGHCRDSEAKLCPPQHLPSRGTLLQSQLIFMSWCQAAPGRTQGCTEAGSSCSGRASQDQRVHLHGGVEIRPQGPALVIWKRDTSEVAVFTENISYARVETRTKEQNMSGLSTAKQLDRGRAGAVPRARQIVPLLTYLAHTTPAFTQDNATFLGITTLMPRSDLPMSQGWGKTGKAGKVLRMGVTAGPEELCNSDQASFSLDKQQCPGDAMCRPRQVTVVDAFVTLVEMTCSLPLPVQDGGSDTIPSWVSLRMKEPRYCPAAHHGEPAAGQAGSLGCCTAHERSAMDTAPVPSPRGEANWKCIPVPSCCASAC